MKYQRSDKQAGALIVWYSVTGEMTEDRAAGSAGNEHSAPPPTETAGGTTDWLTHFSGHTEIPSIEQPTSPGL